MKQVYPAGLLFSLFVLLHLTVQAQDVRIDRGGVVDVCGERFTDSGGAAGNHAPSGTRQVITLCSDGSSEGTHVQLAFTEIDIQGILTVFNGPNTSSDTLRQITRANVGDQLSLSATSDNASGCLTIEFVSIGDAGGWLADVGCIVACQPVIAELASSIPQAVPLRDGYIDVCVGEPITLTGRARFPQNNAIYPQSEATSEFSWTFQNGDGAQGKSVTYAYDEPGAYVAELYVTDDRGCGNTNRINQRIRVAPPPRFVDTPMPSPEICPGETINLLAGTEKTGPHAYRPVPQTVNFTATQTFSEQTSIPDRQDEVYASGLDIELFSPGQRVTEGREIAQICVTIEHSYLADLDMWIECPDGTRVTLLDNQRAANQRVNYRFGYGEVDDTGPEPAETYCFTAEAAQSVYDYILGAEPTGSARPILPFDRTYLPHDLNFDALVGCEMNGEWRLNVVDNQLEDDGTIYSWDITFSEDLVSGDESFTVPVSATAWKDDGGYDHFAPDSVVYTPVHPGFSHHPLSVTDSFGCSYDTLIRVDVVSPLRSDCYQCAPDQALPALDTQVCAGASLAVDLRSQFNMDTLIRWEARERRRITATDTSFLSVTDHSPASLGNSVGSTLREVCVDLTADLSLNEVEISLLSPGGKRLVLLPRGTATSRSLARCFRPGTGNDWSVLANEPVNGNWALIVNDASGRLNASFTNWSMELRHRPPLAFTWEAGQGDLSCVDCPNPVINPSASQTYTLRATTPQGCSQIIDYRVQLFTADIEYAATVADGCWGLNNGRISLQPLTTTSVVSYSWSNGSRTRDIAGLAPGTYRLTVTTANGCEKSFAYDIAPPEDLTLALDTMIAVRCYGESNGGLSVAASGGYGGYTYRWDNNLPGTSGTVRNLRAGNYGVTVTDAEGCTESLAVTVLSPDELALDLSISDVSCRGGGDGSVEAIVSGGTIPYSYRWNDGSIAPLLSGKPAGDYSVTVTDANGCRITARAAVSQPDIPLSARVINEVSGCFGTSTNEATVLARGGNGEYQYRWSNGETGVIAFGLAAGENWVEVTDKSGCAYIHRFTTVSRDPIQPAINRASGDECRPIFDRTLEVRAEGSYFSYRWSTGANGIRITGLAPETTYSVTLTDAEGCTGTTDYTTEEHVPWRFDLETTPVSCFGERDGAIQIRGASNRHGTEFSYRWGANTGFAEGASIVDRPAGSYSLSVEDALGCSFDTSLIIPGPPVMVVTETIKPVSCFGARDGDIRVAAVGGNGDYAYQWSTGASEAAISGLGPGDYGLTVTDASACTQTFTYSLASPAEITLDISSQGPICGGEYNGRIDVTAGGGQAPLEFSLDDERYGEASAFTGLGGGSYTVYVKDQFGCTVSREVAIEDGPPFSVDLGEDLEIVYGDSIALSAVVTGGRGNLDYAWSATTEGTLDCLDCPNPVAKPEYEVDYSLSLMDAMGCLAEDQLRVRVRKIREVDVPTAFTPNDDGHNDRLLVHGRPGTRVIQFSVFDRWGGWLYTQEDFAVNDGESGWDGRDHRGKEMDAGVYIFKAEVEFEDGSRETISGQTTLIR